MIPEISRRCASCGASVRDADALFCAECGKPLSKDAAEPSPAVVEAPKVDDAEGQVAEDQNTSETRVEPSKPSAADPVVRGSVETYGIAGKTRQTLHRASAAASAAARGVIEEPAKRVEKIRHASTTVIEEASYDPSLRFVLVALGLFLVFIILLVVSKFMG